MAASFGQMKAWSQFAAGDWLLFGEKMFPDRYSQAMNELAKEYGTLSNYVWVARQFPPSKRRPGLSWSIHYLAAGIADDSKDKALDVAEHGGQDGAPLTVNQFRTYLKEQGHITSKTKTPTPPAEEPMVRWTEDGSTAYVKLDGDLLKRFASVCFRTETPLQEALLRIVTTATESMEEHLANQDAISDPFGVDASDTEVAPNTSQEEGAPIAS